VQREPIVVFPWQQWTLLYCRQQLVGQRLHREKCCVSVQTMVTRTRHNIIPPILHCQSCTFCALWTVISQFGWKLELTQARCLGYSRENQTTLHAQCKFSRCLVVSGVFYSEISIFVPRLIPYPSRQKRSYPCSSKISRYNTLFGPRLLTCQ
jgi:hypothetical protein